MAEVPVEVKKAPPARDHRSRCVAILPQRNGPAVRPVRQRVRFPVAAPDVRHRTGMASASSFTFSTPAIDMSEDEKAYKISAELPGIDAKDIDVSVSGNTLVLKGEKRQEKEEKDKNYYFSERAYGSFQRAFELPASVDRDKISADFSKGVLTITLPKTADAQKPAEENRGQISLTVAEAAAGYPRRLDPLPAHCLARLRATIVASLG